MPENSHAFFANTTCRYYPCHEGMDEMNCLFCFCPLYHLAHCPGNYRYIEVNGKSIKECTDCTFPHEAESYDTIMALLSGQG